MFENSLLAIIAPMALLLGGILAPITSKKGKGMLATLSAFFIIAIAINTWILLNIGEGALYFPTASGILINSSSAFVVELTLILGFLGAIYSAQYFEDDTHLGAFYALYALFLASLIVMATSFNMLIIYVGFEASTIAGGILILFTRRQSATKAAVRFFIMSVLGAIIILAGILFQNWLTGTYILHVSYYSIASSDMVLLAAIYAIGFSIKVGIFPFGLLWLPAAHSEAPTPLSAILSGVMVQIAAFAVARIVGAIDPVSDTLAWVILGMGAASVIVGAALAAVESTAGSKWSRFHVSQINIRGIKRIWAFSTSSEVGVFYILIGLAILEPALWYVFFMGILLHFLNHGLAKALLFFDSGFVIETSHVARWPFPLSHPRDTGLYDAPGVYISADAPLDHNPRLLCGCLDRFYNTVLTLVLHLEQTKGQCHGHRWPPPKLAPTPPSGHIHCHMHHCLGLDNHTGSQQHRLP